MKEKFDLNKLVLVGETTEASLRRTSEILRDQGLNPNVTIEFIEAHPEFKWDWGGVSENPNLTMDFIEAHPEYHLDWNWVSCNPNLKMDFIISEKISYYKI